MRIIGVIDLLRGDVVRGIAGERHAYRPIRGILADTADPVAIARAYADLGLDAVYLADLDAIAGEPPAFATIDALRALNLRVLVDAGVTDVASGACLLAVPDISIVVGLESVASPETLRDLVALAPDRVVFSLDLKAGVSLGNAAWPVSPRFVLRLALSAGVRRLIVLDLAAVGTGTGVAARDLLAEARFLAPELELITGGGVRGIADLRELASLGVDAVLVASALHDGRITRDDVADVHGRHS